MEKPATEQIARYRRFRAIQVELNRLLPDMLPKGAYLTCGKLLGLAQGNTLTFRSENEAHVLMDYCVYDYRWDGQNVVERYAGQSPFAAGSDEMILLDAMKAARYSLFVVEEVVKGLGVRVQDLLRGNRELVIDLGLGDTAVKGLVLAWRLITPGDCPFSMSTGAALPADRDTLRRVRDEIPRLFENTVGDPNQLSLERASEMSGALIRMSLEAGAAALMEYVDLTRQTAPKAFAGTSRSHPCPCGSGKKYKRCCGI